MHQSAKVSTTLLSTACPRVLFNAVKRLFEAKRLEVAAPWLSRGFLQAGVPGEGELEYQEKGSSKVWSGPCTSWRPKF